MIKNFRTGEYRRQRWGLTELGFFKTAQIGPLGSQPTGAAFQQRLTCSSKFRKAEGTVLS